MICRKSVLGAVMLMAAGTTGYAQEVQSYQYDVHGRLTSVTRTTGSTSQTTTYVLDKANNRTSRAASAPTSSSMSLSKEEGQSQNSADTQTVPEAVHVEGTQEEVSPVVLPNRGGVQ